MEHVLRVLGQVHPSLQTLSGIPLYVFLVVGALTALFLLGYAIQGTRVWLQLYAVSRAVRALKGAASPPDPEQVGKAFKKEPFKHLWEEYRDTLHELRGPGAGSTVLTEFRATVPAESMFTREVLVDSRLFDDFVRHLPGVLTGLGIIGTFAGLLAGLQDFKPFPIEEAVKGLGPLLYGVQHAFVASGISIFCAMGVVFISRLVLAYLYGLVEKLNHGIDSLYSTGAGEEYLARLVKSSEDGARATAQLKDALVEDLHKMMTNLVDRQIAAQEASTAALGRHIGEAISAAISEPMKRVGDAMELTARGNGEQVNTMLEKLITGFMSQLEETFGGQMRNIDGQMQRSMEAMMAVQESLQGLLGDIKRTNEHAASQMSGTLEDAMNKAAENQKVLTDQMREFVQDFRRLVTEEQHKSKEVMDEAIMKVLGEVASAMDGLESVRKAAAVEEAGRNDRLTSQTNELVGGLSGQVEALIGAVSEQVSQTQRNIDALGNVSLRAIDGMNQGALTMNTAAQRFESAGGSVGGVLERASAVSEVLSSSAATLQSASTAVQRGFEQYDNTRKTVDSQVSALMGLIEAAKQEAGLSKELVNHIKASAEALQSSEMQAREHLSQVNDALKTAFSDFGTSLVNQVKDTITVTDKHLSKGTGHLSGVVQELANAVHHMRKT